MFHATRINVYFCVHCTQSYTNLLKIFLNVASLGFFFLQKQELNSFLTLQRWCRCLVTIFDLVCVCVWAAHICLTWMHLKRFKISYRIIYIILNRCDTSIVREKFTSGFVLFLSPLLFVNFFCFTSPWFFFFFLCSLAVVTWSRSSDVNLSVLHKFGKYHFSVVVGNNFYIYILYVALQYSVHTGFQEIFICIIIIIIF